jgi:hypothetical protein
MNVYLHYLRVIYSLVYPRSIGFIFLAVLSAGLAAGWPRAVFLMVGVARVWNELPLAMRAGEFLGGRRDVHCRPSVAERLARLTGKTELI